MTRGVQPVVVCLAAFIVTAASPPSAHAQGSVSDEEALIKRGLELRQTGDDEAALREFRRAHELWHSGRALAQIALAEQALGHWADAESHLAEAIRHEEEPWIARNLRLLTPALGDIRSHLGSLQLSGGAAGAEVLINGARVGTLPLATALRVPAGSVALEVRAPNYMPMLRTVIVSPGGLAREPVVLVPIPSSHRAATAQTSDEQPSVHVDAPPPSDDSTTGGTVATQPGGWSARRKVGVGMISTGAASLAVGIIFHLLRNQDASDFNAAGCTYASGAIGGPPAGNCSSRYNGMQQARNAAIGGYGGAVLFGGVGAFLFFTSD